MPLFHYIALEADGSSVSGEAVSASKDELIRELSSRRLLVLNVRSAERFAWRSFRPRQPAAEVMLVFVQEFVALLRAGLTIPESLHLVCDRPGQAVLSRVLQGVLDDVEKGKTLSAACEQYKDIWDGLLLSALRTGERTGDLSSALGHYVEFLRRRVALRRKVIQALTYPVFLLAALVVCWR